MKQEKSKRAPDPISAEEFDRRFEAGEDISAYVDWDNAVVRFPGSAPKWALKVINEEAKHRGMNREAYIRNMIVVRAKKLIEKQRERKAQSKAPEKV